ncbi:YbhN family protein [Streptomyces sp. RB6PN25]|uniref:YbhN family protein n=1 Tax=Streptomyces humicola TaxID=2953240 RepID=A0ABT1Q4G5_9ACTN|nr:YbhN family protein [Streptomyces humicola]MCQ4084814.1 YbhN family protein [Streptomyces humicola]
MEERTFGRRPGWGWWLAAVVLVAGAVLLAVSHRHELAAALGLLARVRPDRLVVPALCEAGSLVCFAAVQRRLLRAGGAAFGLRFMTCLAVAANAVAGALSGGAAFSAAWLYRQLRRREVRQTLAAAVLVVAGVLSAVSLGLLLVLGALAAGLGGPGAVLRPLIGLLVLALAAGLAVLVLSRFEGFRDGMWQVWTWAGQRSRRLDQAEEALTRLMQEARALQPGLHRWLHPFGLALLNWVLDAACLAASLWALGIGVPWRGLLLAYGLTQIPGSLRLTPGSIGIVETGLAALLVFYGLRADQAIAATLLYRIFSYWLLQPLGWATWLAVTLHAGRAPVAQGRGSR